MTARPTPDEAGLDALVAQLLAEHRRVFPEADDETRRADLARRLRRALGLVAKGDPPPSAGQRWSPAAEARLRALVAKGLEVDEIAARLGRNPGAIRAHLGKLALRDR